MSKVISFSQAKAEREPHMSGEAHCMGCKHKWQAVAPIGKTQLECPACLSLKGIFTFPPLRDGSEYSCNCGNDLFRVCENGIYCANCGTWHRPFD